MQILRKTHEKKLDIKNPISFSTDEIIESLDPGMIFILNDLFFYTISDNFNIINFYLIINNECKSFLSFNVEYQKIILDLFDKEIYRKLLLNNFFSNSDELSKLKISSAKLKYSKMTDDEKRNIAKKQSKPDRKI